MPVKVLGTPRTDALQGTRVLHKIEFSSTSVKPLRVTLLPSCAIRHWCQIDFHADDGDDDDKHEHVVASYFTEVRCNDGFHLHATLIQDLNISNKNRGV